MNFLFSIIRFFQFQCLQKFYFFLHKVILGLMNFGIGGDENGEKYILKRLGKFSESKNKELIIFDVGANVGQYATMVNTYIPHKKLYSFEPSKKTFSVLGENTKDIKNYFPQNFGLSHQSETLQLFYGEGSEGGDVDHSCASLYADNISDFVTQKVVSEDITLKTLDEFCEQENITHIDYLKIDIEGNEYNCLLGAKNMLASGGIDVIQVELNRCSIASKVFFKNYWDLLAETYDVYRTLANNHGLYPIKSYDIYMESFTYINYIFVRKNSDFAQFL